MKASSLAIVALALLAGCTYTPSPEQHQAPFPELQSCDQLTDPGVHELCLRIRDRDPEEFEAVVLTEKFHGHIGPNNIYGVKMALYAKKLLEGEKHEISVLSEAGTITPVSCLNDGIAVAIGSTFGRGMIENIPDSNSPAATFFYGDKSVRLEVKPDVIDAVQQKLLESQGHDNLREVVLYVWENFTQEEMFLVNFEK